MMWKLNKLFLLLIAVSLIVDCVQCKKRKTKRKKNQEEDSDATYSPYFDNEEFKPSVIDGQGNFQGMGPETTTMGLYAPAFPTSEDTTPFNVFPGQVNGFSSFMSNAAPSDQDNAFQMFNDYHGKPAYDDINGPNKDHSSQQDYDAYDYSSSDSTPVYGTKLNAKDVTKKPSLYGDTLNYQNIYSYASTWPTTNVDNLDDLKLSSSNYKTKFKMGPPPTDFSSFKGSFHTDFSENTYAYPTPEPVKGTYESIKEAFSTKSKGTYQNEKDPFSTSSKDSYQNMNDPFSTNNKESYQNMKDTFSTNNKESYQTMKDTFSTNNKESYQTMKDSYTPNFEDTSYKTMKDPFSTKHSYQSMKDHYSSNTKNSNPTMSDAFSTTSKGLHQIKDPFSISSMNSYQNTKSPVSSYKDYYKYKDSFPISNQNVKNEFSTTSLTLEHGNSEDQNDAFDDTAQDKPTVHILPNSYKKYKHNVNYSDPKYNFKNTDLYSSYKDQFKTKPTESYSTLNSLDFNNWNSAVKSHDQYANIKHSSKQTEPDYSSLKNPFSLPEYVGSQSNIKNVIDFTGANYPFKDSTYNSDFTNMKNPSFKDAIDFTNFKNSYKNGDDANSYSSIDDTVVHNWKQPKNKLPSDDTLTKHFALEFMNPTKSSIADSSVPSMTSHWGHLFKNYDPSASLSNFHKSKKPQMDPEDDGTELYIPNIKQTPTSFGKFGSGKTIEEWNKEVAERFKSEEELLGLRNHDTSHPSYLPTYKLKEELSDLKNYGPNFDYGSAVEKWKYLNLQSKKPSAFETHHTPEAQQGYNSVQVPYPKPYPVEIPHPVIVPVPQPYPVRVPVSKPVAVPVIREIRVPVERPVPYPVYKKVPYPVEKLVPVPIEKPVPVPVMRPYPVPIPHVRPVFHHSRPRPYREDSASLADPDSEQYLQESRIRGNAERIRLRPVKSRRARIRPRRRPSAQSRNQRGSRRRPPGRHHPHDNFRRISSPRQNGGSPKQGNRVPKPGNRLPSPRERYHSIHKDKKQSSEEGDRYIDMRLSKYASQFKDLTMEEPSDGHDHSDYFKFCQNNPMCFISSLDMPVME